MTSKKRIALLRSTYADGSCEYQRTKQQTTEGMSTEFSKSPQTELLKSIPDRSDVDLSTKNDETS